MFYAQDAGRMLFVNNMSYQKKAGIQFSTIVRANKHFTLELNYQQNQFANGYQFMQQVSSSAFMSSLLFSWAIREKGVILGDVFVPKGSKFPKIQIKVEDNGMGMPESVKQKIFQPFFTTKPTGQGTGLGMSLSYDIVKSHGGDIQVQSEDGKGTQILIELPT